MSKNKVVILGNSCVGKSSILRQLSRGTFLEEFSSTIGCEFFAKEMLINDEKVKLLLWDTAGQEVFRSFTQNFLRGAKIVIITYDITNIDSYYNISGWLEESIKQEKAKIIIVGNKNDLKSKITSLTLIEELKKKYFNRDIEYYGEVSAKDGDSINNLFYYIGEKLLKTQENNENITEDRVYLTDNPESKSILKCAC